MRIRPIAILTLCLVASLSGQMPSKQFVRPAAGSNPPYSLAVTAGGTIYVAGQLPTNAAGELVGTDIASQAEQVFSNLKGVLAQANSSLEQAVSVTVMLENASDFAALDPVYARQFGAVPPARTTYIGDMVRAGALLEISVIAVPNGIDRKAVLPDGWLKPTSPYSYAIHAGDTLYVSGLVSRNGRDNTMVAGDVPAQTKTIMDNLGEILGAAGMSYQDVVQGRVTLEDMTHFQAMNEVYRATWEKDRPARVSYQASPPGAYDVEITFLAIKGTDTREVIVPLRADGTPGQIGPNFSPAIKVGNRVFVSGGTGVTDDNHGDMKAQTTETLTRLGRSLTAAGFTFADVVESSVYVKGVDGFSTMSETYRSTFPTDPPARATVGVDRLANVEALVEIMVTAVR